MVTIRRVRADEWEALRDLRLNALRGAPEMFGSTSREAAQRPESSWRNAARRGDTDDAWITLVADDGGRLVGMASGLRHDDGVVELIQMWVDPAARRRGLGSGLGSGIVSWAAGRAAPLVRLAVNPDGAEAIALYRALGFRDTGRREEDLFVGRPGLAMIMERPLAPEDR